MEDAPTDVKFNPTGTKMFVLGTENDKVYEYTLTVPFDVSRASYVASFSVNSQENNPLGLWFDPTGTKMFILGQSGKDVNVYTLTVPFDVSTASFVS